MADCSDSGLGASQPERSLRALSINLCQSPPGLGNIRYTVKFTILGAVLSVAMFAGLLGLGLVPPAMAHVLLWYYVAGAVRAKGYHAVSVLFILSCTTGLAEALRRSDVSIVLYLIASLGFVATSYGTVALIVCSAFNIIRPDLANCYNAERLQLLLHHLQEGGPYDIVCVQEFTAVYGVVGYRRKFEEEAAALGLRYVAWSGRWPRFPALFANDGLGILSRYPIDPASVRSMGFREQAGVEWPLLQRGALFASVHVLGAGRVDVLTLHTTSSVESTTANCMLGNSLGGRQVIEALNWFQRLSPRRCSGPSVAASPGQSPCAPQAAAIGSSLELRPPLPTNVEVMQEIEAEEEDEGLVEEENGSEEVLVDVSRWRSSVMLPTALRVVCGDFNLSKDNDDWDALTAAASEHAGLSDAVPDCEPTFGNIDDDGGPTEWLLTFPSDRRFPRVLDHMFADRVPSATRVVAMLNEDPTTHHLYQQASDHRGVEAVFVL